MFQRTFHIARFLPLLGVLLLTTIPLQAQNEIVQNDNAVLLRKVWMVRGGVVGGDRVGSAACSIGDINNDDIEDFVWVIGSTGIWNVQYGGLPISPTPVQSFYHKSTLSYVVVGNFYGESQSKVAFAGFYTTKPAGRTQYHCHIAVYGIDGDTIDLTESASFDPAEGVWPEVETTVTGMYAEDLDNDGDDELIIVVPGVQYDQLVDKRAEVWIFEGGPNFQLDTPTVVLKDTEENSTRFSAVIGDLDGDHFPDILAAGNYDLEGGTTLSKLKFWWGQPQLSQLSTNPDRTIDLVDPNYPRIGNGLTMLDCDGDGVEDIWLPGPDGRYYLYRMGIAQKDARSRPLTLNDADRWYQMNEYGNLALSVGSMNDPRGIYEMVGVIGNPNGDVARMGVLSGGKDGPNGTIDGYYSAGSDGMTAGGVFGVGGPVGDVTGSGYSSYLAANPYWFGGDQGIVVLLEGGPYIPNDDTTLSVREVATEEHRAALHIWPNPVIDELHVAWRGDLKSPPSFLRVYDMRGKLVVGSSVEGWRGEAIWKCESVAAGSYLLVFYDRDERTIAQTNIIKEK